jgi:hypothetical protein
MCVLTSCAISQWHKAAWSNHYLHYSEWFKVTSGSSEFGPNVQQKVRGYNFEPERTTRKSNIKHLERRFNLVHCRPTQVVNVAYVHFHHHNINSNMSTKKRKHNKSDNRNNKNGNWNADVDFQSENEQLGDPNRNYAVKGVQKLDFHPPRAD